MSLPSYDWLEIVGPTETIPDSGWACLLRELLKTIDGLLAGSAERLRLLQVKEKFGRLRFYYRLYDADEELAALIGEAVRQYSDASTRTCFKCGAYASIQNLDGWMLPVCADHASRDAFS